MLNEIYMIHYWTEDTDADVSSWEHDGFFMTKQDAEKHLMLNNYVSSDDFWDAYDNTKSWTHARIYELLVTEPYVE